MHTSAGLLDLHARSHLRLIKLLRHCRRLSEVELHSDFPGFGFPSIQQQLFHIIDTEEWWICVLQGRWDYADAVGNYPTVKTLEGYRKRVAGVTIEYLRSSSEEVLNAPVRVKLGPRRIFDAAPANLLLRSLTHVFHHKGQVVAMCRLLGYPAPSTDLPIRALTARER